MCRKTIFLDIDGTLMNFWGQLPESAEIALKKAKENIKKDGYDAEVYGLNARLILHWMLGKAEENLEGTEKEALEVWYEHINQ